MSDVVLVVDDSNFEKEVLQSEKPVLVDFSAAWCGPCKRQLPIVEKFAENNKERVKVVKLDIDDAPEVTAKYGVKGVPTLLLFNGGQKVDSKVGVTPLAVLETMLTEKTGA